MPAQPIPARSPAVITREVDGEFVVIHDGRALCLSGPSADVWRAAGTVAAVDQAALDEVIRLGLLDAGISRRSMLRRSGVVLGGVGVASIALPMASAAASPAPSASITPTTGPKGTVVNLSGSNFAPNKPIFVTVAGVTAVLSSPGAQTTPSGGIPAGLTFSVPDTGASTGAQPVVVQVNAVSTSAGNFTITVPSLTLNPTSTPLGTAATVTLSGSGYKGTSAMTVQVDGTTVTVTGAPTPNITAAGAIGGTPTIMIPNTTAVGVHTVTVTDASGNVGTQTFKVQPTITSPTVGAPFNPGHNGTGSFTIVGTGFESGAVVTGNGSATGGLTYTYVDSMHINITVTGSGGNGANGSFTVTNPDGTSVTSANGSFKNG